MNNLLRSRPHDTKPGQLVVATPLSTWQQRHKYSWIQKHVGEENARLFLHASYMLTFMLLSAVLFTYAERQAELDHTEKLNQSLRNFEAIMNDNLMNVSDLHQLLYLYGNMTSRGLTQYGRSRWDFLGSFYFVGTVVSTIGYGATFPFTSTGRILVCVLGWIGCAGAILFFNLFLDRIVTVFSYLLRFLKKIQNSVSNKKTKKKLNIPTINIDSDSVSHMSLDLWRPSLFGVWICLAVTSLLLCMTSSVVYHYVEDWGYYETIYFCFVSFATIGFGDMVPSQQSSDAFNSTAHAVTYRIFNFICLTLGCCCFYSFLNVTSVIYRRYLNWNIQKLDSIQLPNCLKRQKKKYLGLGLARELETKRLSDVSSIGDDPDITLKDFLGMNLQRSLAMHQMVASHSENDISQQNANEQSNNQSALSANAVGPLAILAKTFGEE